jgi:Permease family
MTTETVHPVDEKLPAPRLAALGLQHVLVMYAGAIAVPLIVGRALKLTPEQVALLISADLFACGIVTLIQSLGFTRWFGIKLPVMMGVTLRRRRADGRFRQRDAGRGRRAGDLRGDHRCRHHLDDHRARRQQASAWSA